MQSQISEMVTTDSRVAVGRYTYGNPQFMLWDESERIRIGSFCSIADEVVIFGGGEHRTDWVTTFPLRIAFDDYLAGKDGHPASKGETIIGNDVWIGFRAIVLSGITIGDGAVIGAGAVVATDVPSYGVVVGNPAKVIRYRFSAEEIRKLLELCWWEWDIDKIKANISLLSSPDVEKISRNNESK